METVTQARGASGVSMKITPFLEGQLWQLAVTTLGAQGLEQLVAELLKSHVKARAVNMYGFLRVEWLGPAALEALRNGQLRAGGRTSVARERPE